jgi:hypothetical protein
MNPSSLALPPGTLVDTLRIDRVLGQGAFGIIYLVTDTVLSSSFALKEFLPPDLVIRGEGGRLQARDEAARQLFAAGLEHFLAEGRTVAQLQHPNIVKVYRCFEANATAYLLMSYYKGEALHKLLERGGTFSEEEALALSDPLLDALDYCHRHGVIHQDIKPANIYITEDGDPVLLDFGAAGQRLEATAATRLQLGSEGYAAIEQFEPNGDIGPWTDIYGFAATLYRCVSGRVPVSARQRHSASERHEPDPLPALEQLLPKQDFARLIGAIAPGLALDPGDRPRSVATWRPAFSTGITPGEREGREWLPMILLGALAILLITAVVYLFTADRWTTDPTPPQAAAQRGTDADPEPAVPRPASAEETARWEAALEADTAYGYQLFLDDYPASIHRDQAELHLERLDHQAWGRAQEEGSRAAVEAYMQQFPAGRHEAEALIRLEEFRLAEEAAARARSERERQDNEAWEAARALRTGAAMDAYLAAWPDGLHGDEARALRQSLQNEANERRAFEAASKLNTIEAYRAYVNAFPAGADVATALEAIDDLTLRPGKIFRDCADCPTMVVVPAGSFWQGSDEQNPQALKKETPRRMVTIAEPFAVGVFEITLAQWDACVTDGGCSTRAGDNGWGRGNRPAIMPVGICRAGRHGRRLAGWRPGPGL